MNSDIALGVKQKWSLLGTGKGRERAQQANVFG